MRVSMPALFTHTSSDPNRDTAACTSAWAWSSAAHVRLDTDDLVAQVEHLALELVGRLGVRDVVDDDVGAGRGERQHDRAPIPVLPPVHGDAPRAGPPGRPGVRRRRHVRRRGHRIVGHVAPPGRSPTEGRPRSPRMRRSGAVRPVAGVSSGRDTTDDGPSGQDGAAEPTGGAPMTDDDQGETPRRRPTSRS